MELLNRIKPAEIQFPCSETNYLRTEFVSNFYCHSHNPKPFKHLLDKISIQFCLLSVCVSRSGWKWVKSFPNHLQLKSFQKPMRQKISNHVCGNNFVSWSRREKWCWSCFPLHQFSLRMSQELAQCSELWLVFLNSQWRLLGGKSPRNLFAINCAVLSSKLKIP